VNPVRHVLDAVAPDARRSQIAEGHLLRNFKGRNMSIREAPATEAPFRRSFMMDDYQLTIATLFDRIEQFASAREIVFRDPRGEVRRTPFGACALRARSLARSLVSIGVSRGTTVATLMWNQPEHVEAYIAVPAIGAVLHPLNPRLSANELSFIVNDAEDAVIIVDESLLGVFESIRESRKFDHVIVVSRSSWTGAKGEVDYESLLTVPAHGNWPTVDERAAAAMFYTSGTTGQPKGVVYSHRALVLHALTVALPDVFNLSRRDVLMPVVPMFHANGWGLIHAAAVTGARLALPGPRLDAVSLLDLCAEARVTFSAGVPTVWLDVLRALDAEPHRWDLTSLREVFVAGSAAPPAMIRGFDRHGVTIVHGWGMTELTPIGTVSRPGPELEDADDTVRFSARIRHGIASPLVEIRATGEDGARVPWDDQAMGELEVRGPFVAGGYHGGRGSDKFSADGWFATGDVVTIDSTGSVRVRDRAKDLVKSGGEWISSVDLENELMSHESVAEAAVIAVPDERWGERPVAAIVLVPDARADADALRDHLAAAYARWQIPDRFEFISSIPRTSTGKFDKRTLQAQLVGDAGQKRPRRN